MKDTKPEPIPDGAIPVARTFAEKGGGAGAPGHSETKRPS